MLDQTFTDWEQIVYDCGDEPVEQLIPADPRIRYVRGESHGPAADFQAALECATGEIVHPVSDDDRLSRRALSTANKAFWHDWAPHPSGPDVDGASCRVCGLTGSCAQLGIGGYNVSDYQPLCPSVHWLNARTVLVNEAGMPVALRGGTWADIEATRYGQYMLGGAVYWRKSLTDRLGGFDSSFDGAADFDLYSRFLRDSEPARSKSVLYLYTAHQETDSVVNAERQADATRRVAHAA